MARNRNSRAEELGVPSEGRGEPLPENSVETWWIQGCGWVDPPKGSDQLKERMPSSDPSVVAPVGSTSQQ